MVNRQSGTKMSRIIQQHTNWIIIDYVSAEVIERAKSVCDDIEKIDYHEHTSAKGKNSRQYYFTQPIWADNTESAIRSNNENLSWSGFRDQMTDIVQRELVYHTAMPSDWTKLHAATCWTVSGEEGSFHTAHDHGAESISSVLYTDVPDKLEDTQGRSGQIFLILDGSPYSNMSPPKQRIIHIDPAVGLLLIFPSWMIHGVYPQGPGLRRTVNMEFMGTPYKNIGYSSGSTTVSFG